MTLNLHLPTQDRTLRPNITVVGVGGAGGNAVNNMISAALEGVQFVVANTDAQALEGALTERVIQLGRNLTQGLGAGATPEIGQMAAEEAAEEIMNCIAGSHMVFITAGMGGGTGTGAAPVVARMAREQGMLTVGVVTKPFQFEGGKRMKTAEAGLLELQKYVDTLIVIPNQNLFRIANEKTTFADAFRLADEVLHSGVRGVTDLMVKPGLVNLDFADIRTVMQEMGKAMMGTGEASGEKRAIEAAEAAISNPLLDDVSLKGARAALINITGGMDMTLYEVDEAANRIREEIDGDANIIFGSTFSESMQGTIRVSVVATGIDAADMGDNNMARQEPASRPLSKPSPAQQSNFRPTSAYYVGRKPSASASNGSGNNNLGVGNFAGDNNAQANAGSGASNFPTSAAPGLSNSAASPSNAAASSASSSSASSSAFRSEPRISANLAKPSFANPSDVNRNLAAQQKSSVGYAAPSHDEVRNSSPRKEASNNFPASNFLANRDKVSSEQSPNQSYGEVGVDNENAGASENGGAFRILSKIADVGRSLNNAAHARNESMAVGRNIESSQQNYEPVPEVFDDYREHEEGNQYDIPAFLRRKNS